MTSVVEISYIRPSTRFAIYDATINISYSHPQSMEMKSVLEMDPYEEQFTRSIDPEVPFPGWSLCSTA